MGFFFNRDKKDKREQEQRGKIASKEAEFATRNCQEIAAMTSHWCCFMPYREETKQHDNCQEGCVHFDSGHSAVWYDEIWGDIMTYYRSPRCKLWRRND